MSEDCHGTVTQSAENDAPECEVPAKSNPRYCHLRGVRYDARPCAGACALADNDAPRWHLDPPCGHPRCKGYTACRVARSLVDPRVIPPDVDHDGNER